MSSFTNTTPEVVTVSGTSATLNYAPDGTFILLTKNGLKLQPNVDFTISGRNITYTVAAASGDVFLAWYTH